MTSIFEMKKIQFYMAASQGEYDEALAWVQKCKEVETIKEVGYMLSTDWSGNDLDAYVFLFTAPGTVMTDLKKYMNRKGFAA